MALLVVSGLAPGGLGAEAHGSLLHGHRSRHVASHHPSVPRQPIVAVPAGVVEANALVLPDQPFILQNWDGSLETLRKHALAPVPNWSGVMLDDTLLALACRDGVIQHLPPPPDDSKNTTNGTVPGGSLCGLPGGSESIVLAFDQSREGDGATDWSAMWDIARHPGKRGLRLDPRTTLEIALLADGVPPGAIYATLATPTGVDRAFRKLDQLRPYIVWWRTPEDAARIMSSGSALMTSTPADELTAVGQKSGFVALSRQTFRQHLSWAIPRNLPATATASLVATLRDQSPRHDETTEPGASDPQALTIDDAFWADHLEALQQRFQTWLNPSP